MQEKTEFKETEIGLIPEDWELKIFSDIVDIIGGGTPKTKNEEYWNGPIPWLSVVDFNNDFRTVNETEKSITELGLNNSSTKILKKGELIISARGTVGAIAQLGRNMAFNQSCYGLRAKNGISNNDFIYYLLKYSLNILKQNTHGSTFDTITRNTFDLLKVPFPPISEQQIIAKILASLDDKIELNNKMNQTLEEIGQAIFKHWFVHFEFPNAEGKPYKSSGGEMVDSELGETPKGWEVGSINDIIINPISGDWGKEIEEENFSKETFCIRGADIPNISTGNESKAPIRFIKPEKFEKCHLKPFDIVLEISGGSPTQSTGRSVLITADVLNRYENKFICSNFCKVIRTKEEEYSLYLDYLIKYLYFKDFFFQFENGTTGIKNLDFKSLFKYHKILIPPKDIIKDFNMQIITIHEIIHNNGIQSKSLAQIRDSLLPKLMSGKIRVPLEEK